MPALDGLGKAIRSLRIRHGLRTRADFSRATGIDPSNLRKYETGARQPDLETLAKMLDALGEDLVGLGMEMRRGAGYAEEVPGAVLAVLHEEIQGALQRAGWKPEKARRSRGKVPKQ